MSDKSRVKRIQEVITCNEYTAMLLAAYGDYVNSKWDMINHIKSICKYVDIDIRNDSVYLFFDNGIDTEIAKTCINQDGFENVFTDSALFMWRIGEKAKCELTISEAWCLSIGAIDQGSSLEQKLMRLK